jgi:glycolate oxidase FAD binding subunit
VTTSSKTLRPSDQSQLGALIREANESGDSFVPHGGGTASNVGNLPATAAKILDLTGIAGVISYQPADLTLSVSAGTRVADLQAALAEHGQELPVDVPLTEQATIGGLVACGFAGPRRLGSGSLKDLILGCSYVRGDGLVAKAGGSVVKNVSGFEIPRLLHGSWGALAVLTSINFKVTPRPKAEMTLSAPLEDMAPAGQQAHAIRTAYPSITAIEIDHSETESKLLLRLMGRSGALAQQAAGLSKELAADMVADGEDSAAFWQARVDHFATAEDRVQIVLTTRSRFIGEATLEALKRLGLTGSDCEASVSSGLGVTRVRFAPERVQASELWSMLDVTTLPGEARAIVEFAPSAWKKGIDVWGPQPDGAQTMKAIKTAFDPRSVLNPGRLFI